jgi:hypothetical protein
MTKRAGSGSPNPKCHGSKMSRIHYTVKNFDLKILIIAQSYKPPNSESYLSNGQFSWEIGCFCTCRTLSILTEIKKTREPELRIRSRILIRMDPCRCSFELLDPDLDPDTCSTFLIMTRLRIQVLNYKIIFFSLFDLLSSK